MIMRHITQCNEFWQQNSLCKRQRNTRSNQDQWTWASLETRKFTKKKLTIQLGIINSVASINESFQGTRFLWRWFLWVLVLWWWQLLLNTYCFLLFFSFPSLLCFSHSFQTYCWKFIACKGHWIRHVCKIPKVGVCEIFLNPFPFPHWELWDLDNLFFSRQPFFFFVFTISFLINLWVYRGG